MNAYCVEEERVDPQRGTRLQQRMAKARLQLQAIGGQLDSKGIHSNLCDFPDGSSKLVIQWHDVKNS